MRVTPDMFKSIAQISPVQVVVTTSFIIDIHPCPLITKKMLLPSTIISSVGGNKRSYNDLDQPI